MYGIQELKQRLIIIKHSNLDDATILGENYQQMIKDTPNQEEKDQFQALHYVVSDRIKRLIESNV